MLRFGTRQASVAFLLVLLMAAPPGASSQAVAAEVVSANILAGQILQPGGDLPAGGATVRAYHISTGRPFSTVTTQDSGSYLLLELPDGSYEFSIELDGMQYFALEILTVTGGMRQRMSFQLSTKKVPDTLIERLAHLGLDDLRVDGVAELRSNAVGLATAGKGRQVLVLTLVALGSGYLLYELFEDDDVSPSGP